MRAVILILLVAACGGGNGGDGGTGECKGAGDAGVPGATITAGGQSFGYGNFLWGANNDCGMTSITIQGGQIGPPATGFGIGVCIPRPDRIGTAPASLSDRDLIELVGASASGGGCGYVPSAGAVPTGTVTFGSFCTAAGASFTMTFAGQIAGTRSCADAGAPEPITIQLGGTALVNPR